MASANPDHIYPYDTSLQFATFPHPPVDTPRDFQQPGSLGNTDNSFRNFSIPSTQQRSPSISSIATATSRNFSRPVLMNAPKGPDNKSLPHIVVDQSKRNSLTRKPVQPVDSVVVSPVPLPEQLAQRPNSSQFGAVGPVQYDLPASSAEYHQHTPQQSLRYRKSSGALGGMPVQYNPGSQTSTPPTSEGGVSTVSHSRDFSTPETELPEIEALSIQPRQQSLPQNAQVYSNPHTIMPEVAVYHVANQANHQYGMGATAEFVGGEPGPIIEECLELPQPRYPNQYPPYGVGVEPDASRSMESLPRPRSAVTMASSSNSDPARQAGHKVHLSAGGTPSPMASPMLRARNQPGQPSPEHRPHSYIDLLQTPYAQQVAPSPNLDNSFLRQIVGKNASLMEASRTLDAYRANVKNISDPAIQYEFAVFMIQTALELPPESEGPPSRAELIKDARGILQKLVDKSYPFAQYYLADGYASGLFNKGKEDYDRAFPLFVAAAKRGHAEAAYRAGLCYELGWGCRKDYSKAVRFYEMSASKNHPGAATRLGLACLNDMMGLTGKYKDGYKWLKRAAESADVQYNAAPYELAKLHENGFGADIFKDEAYAAQLFTESANLGHPDANLVMGKAYEHGYLGCPQDALLSIHYYTGAANAGEPEGMMALCAWYLFGAPPLLEKNDNEAFEWAKRAADCGYAKAEYAVGYFKEMGIGCKQDTMEANHWYWRAAQQGDDRAKQRMKTIENAVSGGSLKREDEHKTRKSLFGRRGK